MTSEPARHELAAATEAVRAALRRCVTSPEPAALARAALVAAAAAGEPVIATPLSLADLAPEQIPPVGAIVYLASYDDERVVPARIKEREIEDWGSRFKLVHPDAPNAKLKGYGHVQWFDGENVYASSAHAYLALAQQAEDMRRSIAESIVDEQRRRDRFLAAAEDAEEAQPA